MTYLLGMTKREKRMRSDKNMGQLLACNWTMPHLAFRGPTVLKAVGLDCHESQGEGEREGGKLLLRDNVTGDMAIIHMKHMTGKIFGDWFSGEVKVPKHFVRAPQAT